MIASHFLKNLFHRLVPDTRVQTTILKRSNVVFNPSLPVTNQKPVSRYQPIRGQSLVLTLTGDCSEPAAELCSTQGCSWGLAAEIFVKGEIRML